MPETALTKEKELRQMSAAVIPCVCACVRSCVRSCMRACVRAREIVRLCVNRISSQASWLKAHNGEEIKQTRRLTP